MAVTKVQVLDIASLQQFENFLVNTSSQIEETYARLMAVTELQENNWQDPQYDALKSEISSYVSLARSQTTQLDTAAAYIARLIAQLEGI